LKTFLSNLKCYLCDAEVLLQDAIGVLPSGIIGHVVVRCRECRHLLRIAMDKTHVTKRKKKTGPRIFDVNTKLATGIYKMYKSYTCLREVSTIDADQTGVKKKPTQVLKKKKKWNFCD
jgi:hypothetical protein